MTELINLIEDILSFKNKVGYYQDSKEFDSSELSFDIDDIEEAIIPEEVIPREGKEIIDLSGNKESIRKTIKSFMQIIENKFQERDLRLYRKNLNDLKIKKGINLDYILLVLLNPGLIGSYDSKENEIIYNPFYRKTELEVGLFHELFHMASTYNDNKIIYVGFSQFNLEKGRSIGNGINEGYTEYLAQKYYPNATKELSYPYEMQVTNILKSIIGEEEMTSLYLNANLKGLIIKLSKYADIEEIVEFISNVDFVTKNHYKLGGIDLLHQINGKKKKIDSFLAKIYLKSKEDELKRIPITDMNAIKHFKNHYILELRTGPKNKNITPMEDNYYVDKNELIKLLKEKGYYTRTNPVVHR